MGHFCDILQGTVLVVAASPCDVLAHQGEEVQHRRTKYTLPYNHYHPTPTTTTPTTLFVVVNNHLGSLGQPASSSYWQAFSYCHHVQGVRLPWPEVCLAPSR